MNEDLVSRKAKDDELKYFRSKGAWRVMPPVHVQGQRVVGNRQVNSNKGDVENPEIR